MSEIGRRAERRVVRNRYMRPPGALQEIAFLTSCTRCGDCLEVCPVQAIIKVPTAGGLAAGTPMIDPKLQPLHCLRRHTVRRGLPHGGAHAAR